MKSDPTEGDRLDGIVHGSAVQRDSIDVLDFHVPTAGAAAVPWQLPPGTRVFTGREHDHERLGFLLPTSGGANAAVAGVGPVVVGLHGPAGI
ncbi:hypothetical protein K7G98_35575, partial [Saccharothrix sp. MB29]|nr:hypothetical protein [Saccharothrix sp. MB29]